MKLFKLVIKLILLPFTILGFIFSLFGSATADTKKVKIPTFKEDEFTQLLVDSGQFDDGNTIKLPERFRADLVKDDYIIEVDWENKMYEGLGQALTYSYYGDKKPGIVILDDINKNVNYHKFLEVFDHYNVKVWIVEVDKTKLELISVTEWN